MNRTSSIFVAVAIAGAVVMPSAEGGGPGTKKEIPGVTYVCERGKGPNFIHVVKASRSRPVELASALGNDRIYGTAPLTRIVRSAKLIRGAKPLAAVNGSLFHGAPENYYGDPRGIQIVNGELVSSNSSSSKFLCLWIDADGQPHVGKVTSNLRVSWPDGAPDTPISLNEERSEDEAVLYTPLMAHHPKGTRVGVMTTRTVGGTELVLIPPEGSGPLGAGGDYACRVESVQAHGNNPITPGRWILSLGPKLAAPTAKEGSVVTLKSSTSPSLAGVQTAIGTGAIVLMRDGEIPESTAKDKGKRHPRTFFGWNAKEYLFFVVDGRSRSSRGMNYSEAAETAKRHGCTDAIELDGGGSSTLWYNGRVMNRPSDGEQRSLASALILFEK